MADLRFASTLFLAIVICVGLAGAPALAQQAVEFPGTVLKVDEASGKLAVKKEGARFTFVIDGKTKFEGGAKSLKDLKAGDAVTVTYLTMGSQCVE